MEYLRTHPLSTTRIAEARNRIAPADRKLPDDNLNFQLSRARILVEMNKSPVKLIQQIKGLKKKQQSHISNYTLGLAYIANKQTDKAILTLTQLSKSTQHPWVQLALADAYIEADDKSAATKILKNLNTLYPNYLPVSIRYAQLLIDTKQSKQAILLLNLQLRTQKQAIVYNKLARAYFSRGQISLALEATSYEYELEGYLRLASQQINNALQQPELNNITIQRLESRKQELSMRIRKESKR